MRNLLATLGQATTMTLHLTRGAALLAALALVSTTSAQPPLPPPTPIPEQKPEQPDAKKDDAAQPEPGVKVAEKGPIHEAFAQPGAETRGKGLTAPKAPPPPVPEVPPDTKPEGENVRWVPGYWFWDEEKKDFLWVSGFWRNAPPGRTWQAGEWVKNGESWVYTPGFWRPTEMKDWRIDLPEPPEPVESQPSTPPDNPDAVWVPGGWEYRNERYVWRAGYWAYPNDNLMWQPGQYVVSGSGYCYVPGYWDYPLEERGLLYAPVYFTEPLWTTPGWFYRPRLAFGFGFGLGWGTGAFFSSLFYGPGFNNYYYGYGNYFNPWYTGFGGYGGYGGFGGFGYPFLNPIFSLGIGFGSAFGWGGYYPWWYGGHHHHHHNGHNGHHHKGYTNPTWNHYQWLNRNNPNYARQVRNQTLARTAYAPAGAGRPLRVSPTGGAVGGALQSAARTAAGTTAQRPLIQPAEQVLRSYQANRPGPKVGGGAGAAPKIGGSGGAVARPRGPGDGAAGVGSAPRVNRPQTGPPTHAGRPIDVTPGGGRAITNPGAGVRPEPKFGGGPGGGRAIINPGAVRPEPKGGGTGAPTVRSVDPGFNRGQPNLPVRPDGGAGVRPGRPDVTITPGAGGAARPNVTGRSFDPPPAARSGSLPGNPGVGPRIGGDGGAGRAIPSQIRPSAPSLPQVRPSGSSMPQFRPSAPAGQSFRPSAPSFRPSIPSGPSFRPSGGNFGGGRGIGVSPGGGRSFGGAGGARPGGGGGRPGGGKR